MSTETLSRPEQTTVTNPEIGHDTAPLSADDLYDAVTEAAYVSSTECDALWKKHNATESAYRRIGLDEYKSRKSPVYRMYMRSFVDHPDDTIAKLAREETQQWEEVDAPHADELYLTQTATTQLKKLLDIQVINHRNIPLARNLEAIFQNLINERSEAEKRNYPSLKTIDRTLEILQGLIDNPELGRTMAATHRQRKTNPSNTRFDF